MTLAQHHNSQVLPWLSGAPEDAARVGHTDDELKESIPNSMPVDWKNDFKLHFKLNDISLAELGGFCSIKEFLKSQLLFV